MPLDETSFYPMSPYLTEHHPAPLGLASGFHRMNWPKRPPRRINSLWWPQGATRWAEFFAICSTADLSQIAANLQPSESAQAGPGQLVLSDNRYSGATEDDSFNIDENGHIRLSTEMYLLQPRAFSSPPGSGSGTGLALLPLVDERYFWQNRLSDATDVDFDEDEDNTAQDIWESLIDSIGSQVDIGGVNRPSFVDRNLPAPSAALWKRSYLLSTMLEGVAVSTGLRVIRGIDRVVELIAPDDSVTAYTNNLQGPSPFDRWIPIAGTDMSFFRGFGQMKDSLFVYDSAGTDTETQEQEESTGGYEGNKIIFAPNQIAENDREGYQTYVAENYWDWRQKSFDLLFAGIKAWAPTGFDDAMEFRMDFDRWSVDDQTEETDGLGNFSFWTRVQSLPDFCETIVITDPLIKFVKMTQNLQRWDRENDQPATSDATVQIWDAENQEWTDGAETISVDGDWLTGFVFKNERTRVMFDQGSNRWLAVGPGAFFCRGVLADDDSISSGDIGTVNVKQYDIVNDTWDSPADTISIEALEALGLTETLAAGTAVFCSWDDFSQFWLITGAAC